MNPPEVDVVAEDYEVEVIMENMDLVLEMVGEVVRELTEEELEVLMRVGKFLEQWREDVMGYFEEYE